MAITGGVLEIEFKLSYFCLASVCEMSPTREDVEGIVVRCTRLVDGPLNDAGGSKGHIAKMGAELNSLLAKVAELADGAKTPDEIKLRFMWLKSQVTFYEMDLAKQMHETAKDEVIKFQRDCSIAKARSGAYVPAYNVPAPASDAASSNVCEVEVVEIIDPGEPPADAVIRRVAKADSVPLAVSVIRPLAKADSVAGPSAAKRAKITPAKITPKAKLKAAPKEVAAKKMPMPEVVAKAKQKGARFRETLK